MVDIIRLNGDLHTQTQRLLPWYVTDTLENDEAAKVEEHLAECAECREDVARERALARQIRALPSDADRGWAALKARIDGTQPVPRKTALFGRRIPIGWAMAAQAASLAILVPLIGVMLARPPAVYRTLGSAPVAAAGNLIVIFKPQAPEAALRSILVQNQARIVDGPTTADAYVLHVAADRRGAVLARLKGDRNISMAEPIDGDNR
jgi:anti-sigma factor RsiW